MILISKVETVRLTLDVSLFLVLCIFLLDLVKGNFRLLLTGGLPEFSVISDLRDIFVQQFHHYQEVFRIPIQSHDVVNFISILSCLQLKLYLPIRKSHVRYHYLVLMFALRHV